MIEASLPPAPPSDGLFVPEEVDFPVVSSPRSSTSPRTQSRSFGRLSNADGGRGEDDGLMSLDDILQDPEVELVTETNRSVSPNGNGTSVLPTEISPHLSSDELTGDGKSSDKQKSRPPRKATKKALEEMHRETLRMTRAMNLQHEASTRKTFSLTGFLSKFVEAPQESVPDEPQLPPRRPPVLSQTSHLSRRTSDEDDDSDDSASDLEIVPSQSTADTPLSVLDKALSMVRGPDKVSQEQRQMILLRNLANLHASPPRTASKNSARPASMTAGQLSRYLQKKARDQATEDREARIRKLVSEGLYDDPSAAEKERQQMEVEELLEKARLEAKRIAKADKEAGGAEKDHYDDDEDSDEEEIFSASENVDPELIDSEMEEDEEDGSTTENEEEDEAEEEHKDGANETSKSLKGLRRRTVLDEDDEMEDRPPQPEARTATGADAENDPELLILNTQMSDQPQGSLMTQGDPYAAIRKLAPPEPSMSLSQAFAGTIGDLVDDQESQSSNFRDFGGPVPGALADLNSIRDQTPQPDAYQDDTSPRVQVASTPILPEGFSQLGTPGTDWAAIDPSQDRGFEVSRSPAKPAKTTQSEPSLTSARQASEPQSSPRKRKRDHKNKITTKLKEKTPRATEKPSEEVQGLFDEEAALSDSDLAEFSDEQDDGDSMDEDCEFDTRMIDDDTAFTQADQEAMRDLHAAQTKAADQKMLNRLVRDLDSGGLRDLHNRRRRNRGLDGDAGGGHQFLSDDSDDEAAERRRRKKQQEFARVRRALLAADQRIAGMAENPKQEAFLRAIEDRDVEQDFGWLDRDYSDSNSVSTSPYPGSEGARNSASSSSRTSARTSRLGSPIGDESTSRRSVDGGEDDDDDEEIGTSKGRLSNGKRRLRSKFGKSGSRLRFSSQMDTGPDGPDGGVVASRISDLLPEEPDRHGAFVELSDSGSESDDEDGMSATGSGASTPMPVIDRVVSKPAATSTSALFSNSGTAASTATPATTATKKPHNPLLFRRLMHKNMNKLGSGFGSGAGTTTTSRTTSTTSSTDVVIINRHHPPSSGGGSHPSSTSDFPVSAPSGYGSVRPGLVAASQQQRHKDGAGTGKDEKRAKLLGDMLQNDGFD